MTEYRGKRVLFPEVGKVEIADWSSEGPKKGQVMMKNIASLVSAGTELSILYGYHTKPRTYPRNSGYASCAEVVEVGESVEHISEGELYVCSMGHISHLNVDTEKLVPVPEGIKPEHAVFSIVGAISLRAVRQANITVGDSVLVVGLGLIGQFAQIFSRIAGGIPVAGADLSGYRRSIGEKTGLIHALDPKADDYEEKLNSISPQGRFGAVLDSTGTPDVFAGLPEYTADNGRIIILGGVHKKVEFDFYTHAMKRNLSIIGAGYPDPRDWPYDRFENWNVILSLMAEGRLDVSPLLTHHVDYTEAPDMYPMLRDDKDRVLGTVFKWR